MFRAIILSLTLAVGCGSSGGGDQATAVGQELPPPPAPCPPVSSGSAIGQVPSDVTLRDCQGNAVQLHDLCANDAVWIYRYHHWCEACAYPMTRLVNQRAEAHRDRSYASWVVIVEDEVLEPPTAETCQAVTTQYGTTVPVLYDPTGQLDKAIEWDTEDNRDVVFRRGMILEYKGETRMPDDVDPILNRLLRVD